MLFLFRGYYSHFCRLYADLALAFPFRVSPLFLLFRALVSSCLHVACCSYCAGLAFYYFNFVCCSRLCVTLSPVLFAFRALLSAFLLSFRVVSPLLILACRLHGCCSFLHGFFRVLFVLHALDSVFFDAFGLVFGS